MSGAVGITVPTQRKGTEMTPNTAFAFDGTAALDARPYELYLIRGGRCARTEKKVPCRRVKPQLSRRQCLSLTISSVALIAFLLVLSTVSDALAHQASLSQIESAPKRTVVVDSGDTLWSLAETSSLDEVPTAEIVAWMRCANNIDEDPIRPGQKLLVPGLG